jgi:hypothetical protein
LPGSCLGCPSVGAPALRLAMQQQQLLFRPGVHLSNNVYAFASACTSIGVGVPTWMLQLAICSHWLTLHGCPLLCVCVLGFADGCRQAGCMRMQQLHICIEAACSRHSQQQQHIRTATLCCRELHTRLVQTARLHQAVMDPLRGPVDLLGAAPAVARHSKMQQLLQQQASRATTAAPVGCLGVICSDKHSRSRHSHRGLCLRSSSSNCNHKVSSSSSSRLQMPAGVPEGEQRHWAMCRRAAAQPSQQCLWSATWVHQ